MSNMRIDKNSVTNAGELKDLLTLMGRLYLFKGKYTVLDLVRAIFEHLMECLLWLNHHRNCYDLIRFS